MLMRKNNRDFRFAFIPTCACTYVQDMPTTPNKKMPLLNLFFTAEQGERTISPSNTPIWRENQNMLAELKYKKIPNNHITTAKKTRNQKKKTFLKAALQMFGFKYRLSTVYVCGTCICTKKLQQYRIFKKQYAFFIARDSIVLPH